MSALLWTIAAFLSGSIPFSPLIGRLALGRDIRDVGDHNPGATNVLRAGGMFWGGLALALDISKGALPVGIAWQLLGMRGWAAVPIALAPVVGHAYSPWLGLRGGKAIASTYGIWIGLTQGLGALLLVGVMLGVYAVTDNPGWTMLAALAGLGAGLLLADARPPLLAIWALNTALIAWTHRADLRRPAQPRPWLARRLRGRP